jgi:3-methyladenine DNA glycosylase/8-oxoguanine DNA glycosylase
MPRFMLPVPGDFDLPRDFCSYGYFLLAPNLWDPGTRSLTRPLRLASRIVGVQITQPRGTGTSLRVHTTHTLDSTERLDAAAQISRMLRLDEDETSIAAFHRLDPRWKQSGRGRVSRSPTLFEDVIKTITNCNINWPGTVQMNRRLCEVLGRGPDIPAQVEDAKSFCLNAFPSAERLARTRPQTLRARCRVGYRDARIVRIARLFRTSPSRGGLDVRLLEDPSTPDEVVLRTLLSLPGIGPYAAANIMQLLGRYSHLPLDTESIRHGRTVLGFRGSPRAVMNRVRKHFEPYGPQAFRSYWLELWAFYESKHGPAWTWQRDSTGMLFTASHLTRQ